MGTVLRVKKMRGGKLEITYPSKHPKVEKIEKWLAYLSPGYVEHLIHFGTDPHCSACRDVGCENVGMGDDACQGFKFGLRW